MPHLPDRLAQHLASASTDTVWHVSVHARFETEALPTVSELTHSFHFTAGAATRFMPTASIAGWVRGSKQVKRQNVPSARRAFDTRVLAD